MEVYILFILLLLSGPLCLNESSLEYGYSMQATSGTIVEYPATHTVRTQSRSSVTFSRSICSSSRGYKGLCELRGILQLYFKRIWILSPYQRHGLNLMITYSTPWMHSRWLLSPSYPPDQKRPVEGLHFFFDPVYLLVWKITTLTP